MKWSILGLVLLGLAAGVAAVVLVFSLQNPAIAAPLLGASSGAESVPPADVPVLVAARDLEMRTILSSDDVEERTIPAEAAPPGVLVDAVQAIGKVLLVPVREGQALTTEKFASEGRGIQFAASVASGRRAVSISLDDDMGMEPLLFPGCVVDVLASIEVEHSEIGKQPVSFTLLQQVLVLAVGTSTVVAPESDEDERTAGRNRPSVTLLLSPDEAQALKLAMERGKVSFSMRNPSDDGPAADGSTSLAVLSPVLAEAERRAVEAVRKREREEREKVEFEMEKSRNQAELARLQYENEKRKLEQAADEHVETWDVLILRGGTPETKSFKKSDVDRR